MGNSTAIIRGDVSSLLPICYKRALLHTDSLSVLSNAIYKHIRRPKKSVCVHQVHGVVFMAWIAGRRIVLVLMAMGAGSIFCARPFAICKKWQIACLPMMAHASCMTRGLPVTPTLLCATGGSSLHIFGSTMLHPTTG